MSEHTPTPWSAWDVIAAGYDGKRKTRMFGIQGEHAVGRVESGNSYRADTDRAFIVKAVNNYRGLVDIAHIARNYLSELSQQDKYAADDLQLITERLKALGELE